MGVHRHKDSQPNFCGSPDPHVIVAYMTTHVNNAVGVMAAVSVHVSRASVDRSELIELVLGIYMLAYSWLILYSE